MKRVLHMLLVICLTVATGCGEFILPTGEKRMVLVYIAASESSLTSYADGNVADLLHGHVPSRYSSTEDLLVFFQEHDNSTASRKSDATLTRYYAKGNGEIVKEPIASFGSDFDACTPESFAKVLATAEAASRPTIRTLLFSSHGTGWMPHGYFDSPGEKSKSRKTIGYDCTTKNELDIRDFAAVLGKYHWEALLLDCCYMGTVESAYQLRNCCDWIIASPTEILVQGFPYTYILDQLFLYPGQTGLETICQRYYELYQGQSGSLQSGTISLTKCSELDNLADICANIVAQRRTEMEAVKRLDVQHYYYSPSKDYFFDLAHYFEKFATASQYSSFCEQLDKAVPFKKATAQFLGLKINRFSGLSIYIPDSRYVNLNAYYGDLDWNKKVKVIE